MWTFVLILAVIFIPALLIAGPVIWLLERRRRRKLEAERQQPDYEVRLIEKNYRELQHALKEWGWFLIVFSVIAIALSLFNPITIEPLNMKLFSGGAAVVTLIMGIMFLNSTDTSMFGIYAINLLGSSLFDLFALTPIGLGIFVGRIIFTVYFFRFYRRHTKTYASYVHLHYPTLDTSVPGATSRAYVAPATWAGGAALAAAVLTACSFFVVPFKDPSQPPGITLALLEFSAAAGMLAIGLAIMAFVEKVPNAPSTIAGGMMGLMPVIVVLGLGLLGGIITLFAPENLPQMAVIPSSPTPSREVRPPPSPMPSPSPTLPPTPTFSPLVRGIVQLPFRVTDADYSASLHRLIVVDETPPRLYLLDPVTQDTVEVELPLPPTQVSVSPDGYFAAVGHNRVISYVDLQQGKVIYQLDTRITVGAIFLPGNGWVYAAPCPGQTGPEDDVLYAIEIATNREEHQPLDQKYHDLSMALRSDGRLLYVAGEGKESAWLARMYIGKNGLPYVEKTVVQDIQRRYYDLWIIDNDNRVITTTGDVWNLSSSAAADLESNVHVWDQHDFVSVAALTDQLLAVRYPACAVELWDPKTVTPQDTILLPYLTNNNKRVETIARSVFADSSQEQFYVIVQVSPGAAGGLLHDFGLVIGTLKEGP